MRFFFLYIIFPFVPYWILLCLTYFGHPETHNTSITEDTTVARFDFLSPHTYAFISPVVAPSVGLASVVISTTAITYHPAPEPKIFMLMGSSSVGYSATSSFLPPPKLAAFCFLYSVFYRSLVNAGINREQMGLLGFPFYLGRCLVAGITAIFWTITFPFACLGSTFIVLGTAIIDLETTVIDLGTTVISFGTVFVNFGTKMVELLRTFCNKVPTSPILPSPCPGTPAQIPLSSSRSDINICPPPPYSPSDNDNDTLVKKDWRTLSPV